MRKIFFVLFTLILILPLFSAATIELKDTLGQGETLIAKILGNFPSSIDKENILFYRNGYVKIPLNYNLANIDGEYYLYASLLGKDPGNYSINITNLQYYQNGVLVHDGTISKSFSISNETVQFSITPGFVVASEDFSITLQNLMDEKITIHITASTDDEEAREIYMQPEANEETKEQDIDFKPGEKKDIQFKLDEGNSGVWNIAFSSSNTSYNIPVYVISNTVVYQNPSFSIEPQTIVYFLSTGSETKETVYLYNTGDTKIENISLALSSSLEGIVSLPENNIEELEANSSVPVELVILSHETEEEINGRIDATAGTIFSAATISISFEKDYVPSSDDQVSSSPRTCSDLGWVVCDLNNETCSTDSVSGSDHLCCKGVCNKIKDKKDNKKVVAVIILAFLLIGFIFLYKKYKKTKKPVNLIEIAKGKDKPIKSPTDLK